MAIVGFRWCDFEVSFWGHTPYDYRKIASFLFASIWLWIKRANLDTSGPNFLEYWRRIYTGNIVCECKWIPLHLKHLQSLMLTLEETLCFLAFIRGKTKNRTILKTFRHSEYSFIYIHFFLSFKVIENIHVNLLNYFSIVFIVFMGTSESS